MTTQATANVTNFEAEQFNAMEIFEALCAAKKEMPIQKNKLAHFLANALIHSKNIEVFCELWNKAKNSGNTTLFDNIAKYADIFAGNYEGMEINEDTGKVTVYVKKPVKNQSHKLIDYGMFKGQTICAINKTLLPNETAYMAMREKAKFLKDISMEQISIKVIETGFEQKRKIYKEIKRLAGKYANIDAKMELDMVINNLLEDIEKYESEME